MSGLSRAKRHIIVEEVRRAKLSELLLEGKRLDGRGLLDYRSLSFEVNVIEKAQGSARVRLGNTQVIAGVKTAVLPPFPDTPNEGVLIVNAEILPLASPYTEPGPPDENAIELARVVDRGIRETGMIPLSELAIVPGKQVMALYVDISVLDMDGNLKDAASFASVLALATARVPVYKTKDSGSIEKTSESSFLKVTTLPVSVTFAKIGDVIIVDPSAEEEALMDTALTLVTDSEHNICAAQKGHTGYWSLDELKSLSDKAVEKGEEIRERLMEVIQRARSKDQDNAGAARG
jgi:exosome complex component RRP42